MKNKKDNVILFYIVLAVLFAISSHNADNIITEHFYALITLIALVAARIEYIVIYKTNKDK